MGGGLLYVFFILFFFFPAILPAQEPEGVVPDNMMMDTSATVFEYRRLGITAVAPSNGVEFLFLPNNSSSLPDVAERLRYNYLINASSDSAGANYRTGLLKIGGIQYGSFIEDKSRSYIVRIDRPSGRVAFIPHSAFISDSSKTVLEFQAGPLIIENGKAVSSQIQKPGEKHRRTLLALLGNTEMYLLVTRGQYALPDLAEKLVSFSIFKGKRLDVIVLAAGDSSAVYARNFPRVNLNAEGRMPLLIGIR